MNHFILGNSYLSRRTYRDNSVELVKPRVALDMFKTFTTTAQSVVIITTRSLAESTFITSRLHLCSFSDLHLDTERAEGIES